MKHLFKIIIVACLLISVGVVYGDEPISEVYQTEIFFGGLSRCLVGSYKEQNLLADSSDTMWLNQEVVGLDEQGYCHARLSTPDGRTLQCYFDPYDLADLGTPRFINGIKALYKNPQERKGMAAEQQWSQLKDQNCGFEH